MTTQAWATPLDHTSDAGFRAWGSELSAKMGLVGLTQTADTGQINWASVVRAAAGNDAGYEVWRFNDAQQSTAPVFFKIFYGTNASATIPRIKIQVGTASNGSGTVSGLGSANTDTITINSAALSIVALYTSYMCYVDGSFSFQWKAGATGSGANYPEAAYSMCRSVDNLGVASPDTLAQTWGPGASAANARSISYLTSTIYGGTTGVTQPSWALLAYNLASSLVGGIPQIFKTYMVTPRMRPQMQMLLGNISEFTFGNDVVVAVVGTTTRNYRATWQTAATLGAAGMLLTLYE